MKLGVSLIVKNEERDLPRMLQSIRGVADVLYVLDTGSTDGTAGVISKFIIENPETRVFYHQYTEASEYVDGDWKLRDFSKARNKCLELIDSYCDYVLVLDADDELVEGNKLKIILEYEEPASFSFTIKSVGSKISEFYSYRCWPTKLGIKYHGAVHEYPDWGNLRRVSTGLTINHWTEPNPKQECGIARNLRIASAEYVAGNREHRLLFYYGRSLQDAGQWREAERVYTEYLDKEIDFWEERRLAHLYRMRCTRAYGNLQGAIQQGWTALAEDRRMSEHMITMAEMYVELKEYDKAIGMCYMALQKPPQAVLWIEHEAYEHKPWKMIKEIFLLKNGMK